RGESTSRSLRYRSSSSIAPRDRARCRGRSCARRSGWSGDCGFGRSRAQCELSREPTLVIHRGRAFYKLTGSGNDFVFIDVRSEPAGVLENVATIRAVCARGSGVGADGIVFLSSGESSPVAIRYLNSDGSAAALCGNATLCAARLAAELRIVSGDRDFTIATDAGDV